MPGSNGGGDYASVFNTDAVAVKAEGNKAEHTYVC